MGELYTISKFRKEFTDDNVCLDFLFKHRYGNTKECPKCKGVFKYYRINDRKCYGCGHSHCGHQIYPTKGTIFERSTVSLTDWFQIILEFTKSKNGISAKEIERKLGVAYKTAWRMGHQIRKLMTEDKLLLDGIVEIDESKIGGKKNKKKACIFGMTERKGRIVAMVVSDNPNGEELVPIIKQHVKGGATIYTDKFGGYQVLNGEGYKHKSISHKQSFAYRNGISTNCIEGFWSYFKNSILGTHKHISRKWMQKYLDEFVYRYNRKVEGVEFLEVIKRIGY